MEQSPDELISIIVKSSGKGSSAGAVQLVVGDECFDFPFSANIRREGQARYIAEHLTERLKAGCMIPNWLKLYQAVSVRPGRTVVVINAMLKQVKDDYISTKALNELLGHSNTGATQELYIKMLNEGWLKRKRIKNLYYYAVDQLPIDYTVDSTLTNDVIEALWGGRDSFSRRRGEVRDYVEGEAKGTLVRWLSSSNEIRQRYSPNSRSREQAELLLEACNVHYKATKRNPVWYGIKKRYGIMAKQYVVAHTIAQQRGAKCKIARLSKLTGLEQGVLELPLKTLMALGYVSLNSDGYYILEALFKQLPMYQRIKEPLDTDVILAIFGHKQKAAQIN
jgi:hypothetical protein